MKGVLVILDGVADETIGSLKNKTPLGAAFTPNLDYLASLSSIYSCIIIKRGVVPESSSGILSLLGYPPFAVERGPLEALGAGLSFSKGNLVLRTNFATIENINSMRLIDRRAGRTLSTNEANLLAKAINNRVKLPYKFHFYVTIQHRGIVIFKGNFSNNFSNIDPHYSTGFASGQREIVSFARSNDKNPLSKISADLVNMFVRNSYEVLNKHPINLARVKKGLYSANFLLCRDPGIKLPNLIKIRGRWMASTYMPLEQGIARATKMKFFSFKYPSLHDFDVYKNLYAGLVLAIKNAIKMIHKNASKYDYFLVHFKETDIPGHDNKPIEKVKMIELIDRKFFSFLVPFVQKHKARVVITADHATFCRLKSHTDAPVPVLFFNPLKIKKSNHRFNEQDMPIRSFFGNRLLDLTLFS